MYQTVFYAFWTPKLMRVSLSLQKKCGMAQPDKNTLSALTDIT
jgi:hypothetical protein